MMESSTSFPSATTVVMTTMALLATMGGGVEAQTVIQVDHTQTFQNFYGCGASWTDSSAWIMNGARNGGDPRSLTATEKTNIMNDLFSKDLNCNNGCIGLDILRQPMGTSDFRWSDYTYEDTRGQFTIQRDMSYIIPTIQQSKTINPNLKVMALPWSAPAWAKANNNLNGGQYTYDTNARNDYHGYFVDFVDAYTAQGIPIWAISVQNEPQHESNDYPTMGMGSFEHGTLIQGVRTALDSANYPNIKVVGYDHNWDTPWYVSNFMNTQSVRQSVDAIGFHCYGGNVAEQTNIKNQYPEVEIFFTECTEHGTLGAFNPDFRWALRELVIGATRNWASTVIEWNMVLMNNGPKMYGGCSNCRGLIDITSNGYTKNPAFYAFGHLSKFVKPGAKRIFSSQPTGNTKTLAMLNPDNSSFLIILNDGSPDMTYNVNNWMGANCQNVFVRSWSAVTLYRGPNASLTMNVWRTTDQDSNTRLKRTENITCTQIPGAPVVAPVPAPVPTAPVPVPTAPVPVPTAPVPVPVPVRVPSPPVPKPAPVPVPVPSPTLVCPPVTPPSPQTCPTSMKEQVEKLAKECGMTVS